jgi:beta-galactosidase
MGKIYQTLPLFEGLQTQGTYIYPSNISVANGTADINVESEVHNNSGDRATAGLSVVVVDKDGKVCAQFAGDPVDMVDGEKTVHLATGSMKDVKFWSTDEPNLYDVYTILTVEGKVVDVQKTTTGFRDVAFKGGAGTGGVYINGKFVYLKGYAQRSTDEWAGLGEAYPTWMHDLNAQIVRDSNGNYMRWMHISPQVVDVEAYDKYGIVEVSPAGDNEGDVTGPRWDQRVAVMRDSMIYLRNHPSILFWEAGNSGITADQLQQMKDLKDQYDPHGGRAIGCRTLSDPKTTPIAEYFGVMIGQDPRTDALQGYTDMFRAYSAERRDKAPLIETEDFRDEAARRFWDDYSPPHFGFKPGPNDTYHWNSETFCIAAAQRYYAYYRERISNTDPKNSKWSGYASIYFFDSNADGRQDSSEVARVSGKVDAVRLPKEAFYTYQVMQSEKPAIHIIGHWSYPVGTKKTIYVVSNTQSVELMLHGKSLGKSSTPMSDKGGDTGYIFAFPDVTTQAGPLVAIGYNDGKDVCQYELNTVGPPVAIRLTPIVGPDGLQADGADVALFDFEAVDANGQRCPTDEARVDFTVTGPGIWRGGYNSGIVDSTNNLYLNTECGINRVAIRSTLTPGKITLTASRPGLASATISVDAKPFVEKDGIATQLPAELAGPSVQVPWQ